MAFTITVDLQACQGYANCLIEGPKIFDFDEDTNKAVVMNAEHDEALRAQGEASVRGCPAHAIALQDLS